MILKSYKTHNAPLWDVGLIRIADSDSVFLRVNLPNMPAYQHDASAALLELHAQFGGRVRG